MVYIVTCTSKTFFKKKLLTAVLTAEPKGADVADVDELDDVDRYTDSGFSWSELARALPYIVVVCSLCIGVVGGQKQLNNRVSAIVADR